MDTLDSRALGYFDCYFRQFPEVGTVRYSLAAAELHPSPEEAPFTVEVAGRPGRAPVQHDVTVRVGKDGRLEPDREELAVAPGDHVMFHAANARTPRYSVRGSGPGGAWSSGELENDSLFSHTFGLPGEYRLTDANSGRLVAALVVSNPPLADAGAGLAVRDAAIISIQGGDFKTQRAEMVVGQTAVFVVNDVREPGITITDHALLGPPPSPGEPFLTRERE
ncbi:MAG TPA: hypothetical protein VEX86_00585 [Longimicrobium sp.]|nr:hypothetical protein [Longimicrobium sp.]